MPVGIFSGCLKCCYAFHPYMNEFPLSFLGMLPETCFHMITNFPLWHFSCPVASVWILDSQKCCHSSYCVCINIVFCQCIVFICIYKYRTQMFSFFKYHCCMQVSSAFDLSTVRSKWRLDRPLLSAHSFVFPCQSSLPYSIICHRHLVW